MKIEIEVDIPDGYEATGGFREPLVGENFIAKEGTLDCRSWPGEMGPRIILRKKELKLRLPEGWSQSHYVSQSTKSHVVVAAISPDPSLEVRVWHPDKATAIRMAQAAVDAVEVKCESP